MGRRFFLSKIFDKITFFQQNKSNNSEMNLKNSDLEVTYGNKVNTRIENQTVNVYNTPSTQNIKSLKKSITYKWNINKFRNDVKNKKIVIFDPANNFPEKELLIKYGFKNIVIVKTINALKNQQEIGAVIYRYRPVRYNYQVEILKPKKWIFWLCKMEVVYESKEDYKVNENLNELVEYISKLNIPLFVYSYPYRVNGEEWEKLVSYYFVVFANFPLMLINHLVNILNINKFLKK